MVSEKVAKISVLIINYLFLVFVGILSILFGINIQEQSELLIFLESFIACLVSMAGCYGAHKSNTCMLTMNGIYKIISSCVKLIIGIILLVFSPPDMKAYSLIVFAWVAVEMAGGILAIHLSKCIKIKRNDKERLILINEEDCTGA